MYKLVPKRPKHKTFTVTIVADSNDADYITAIGEYKEEDFKALSIILKDIKDNFSKSHQLETWNSDRYKTLFTQEQLKVMGVTVDELLDVAEYLCIPINDWDYEYCHTLERLEVTCIDVDGITYDVVI